MEEMKVSSIRRIISSRTNGALSTGPVTEEGKQRSSQNAMRHGLLSRSVVLQNESQDAFREQLEQYVQSFDPQIPVEMDMIEEMTSAYWRMRRLWAVETRMWDEQLDQQTSGDQMTRLTGSFGMLADTNRFGVLNRYEARLHRIYQRALKNLLLLRSQNTTLPNEPTL
jgi:hypothetical protein